MFRKFGKDIAIYGGADLLFKLGQFVFIPVYSHALSVEEFGVLAMLQVSAILIGILVNLGVNYSIQRFYYDRDIAEDRRPVLVTTGLVQLLVTSTILLFLLAFFLQHHQVSLFVDYGLPWTLVLIGLVTILPDQIAQYALDTTRLQFAPFHFLMIALVKNLLGLLLGLWLLLHAGLGLYGLMIGNLVAALLAAPLGLLLIRRDLTLRIDRAYFGMMLRFGTPFIFTAAAYWVFGSMDRWLLAELSDSVQVGLFSIAFKFASGLALVITAFHQAWIPIAMRMARDEPDYREIFAVILDVWFFFLAFIALSMALFANEVMLLLTPEPYWPAAPMLAIGAAAIAISGTTQVTSIGLSLEKRTGSIALVSWLAAAVNVALNLLLIPHLGGQGSALATLLAYLVLTGLFLFLSQRIHPLPLHYFKLAFALLVVAAAVVAPLFPAASLFDPFSTFARLCLLGLVLIGGVATGIIPRDLIKRVRSIRRPLS